VKSDKRDYLVFVVLDHAHRDSVKVNIRVSGEAESTAENNEISLNEFRRIFLEFFKSPSEILDAWVQQLRDGHGYTINVFSREESIRESGLLSRTAGSDVAGTSDGVAS
jgi:hypothetical protein